MQLDILETELLPSDVTKVKFYRPPNMKVLSGQWIRFTCTAIQPEEYHSLTLTSAPHEDFLSVHVKAHGPWTWKLRAWTIGWLCLKAISRSLRCWSRWKNDCFKGLLNRPAA